MRKVLFLTSFLLASFVGLAYAKANKIDPYLQTVIDQSSDKDLIQVNISIAGKLTTEYFQNLVLGMPESSRRQIVIKELKASAEATQSRIRNYLNEMNHANKSFDMNIIWVANVISTKATKDVIQALAGFDEVEGIFYDAVQPEAAVLDLETYNDPSSSSFESEDLTGMKSINPGLTLINAPKVWELGYTGEGIVIANIDTGADYEHADLEKHIWINSGEICDNGIDDDNNGFVDDCIGWNFAENNKDPMDRNGHGTQTSGIVVGDGTNGRQTGVAPGAKLMILRAIPAGESAVWSAMQYAIDNGAHITTSSISWKWSSRPKPNYAIWRQMTDMEYAAGVIHTNSIGNQGNQLGTHPIPYNISTPGNAPSSWLHRDQTLMGEVSSVIACGNVDAMTDTIVATSGRGPAAWEDIKATHPEYPYDIPEEYQDYPYETISKSQGLIKPDISAPGARTVSTIRAGGYGRFSGTSAATPHVAGTVALMLQANPCLTSEDVSRILQTTAIRRSKPGSKDNVYGAGRIDALEAVMASISEVAFTSECKSKKQ